MTRDRSAELRMLRDWCLVVIAFIGEVGPPSPIVTLTKQAIGAAFDRSDHRGLKMISSDLAELAGDLPSDKQKELDNLLRSRFGKGLDIDATTKETLIQRVLERGKILTKGEYRIVLESVEAIYADETKQREVEQLNSLLTAYMAQTL